REEDGDDRRNALLVNQVVEHHGHERTRLAVGRRWVCGNVLLSVLHHDEGGGGIGHVSGRNVDGDLALKRLMLRRLCRNLRGRFAAGTALSTAPPGRCGWKGLALGGVHREADDTSLWHIRLGRERRIRHPRWG